MAIAVQPSREALRDALCRLAVAYGSESLQGELEALRACAGCTYFTRLRDLLLPLQVPVLESLGFHAGPEGLAQLEAAVVQGAEQGDLELLRAANAALGVVKIPPIACKVRDPEFAALLHMRRREIGPAPDPLEMLREHGERRDFWRSLCPWLHVCDGDVGGEDQRVLAPSEVAAMRDDLAGEGYFAFGPGSVSWDVNVSGVARGVAALAALGLPAMCIFAYDEPWAIAARLRQLAKEEAPGREVLFDWWAFHVKPGMVPGGPPSRDRTGGASQAGGFYDNGSPQYVAFWVPLTASSPETSCLMAVPRSRDPGYTGGDAEASPIRTILRKPGDFQSIRALPVPAGGLIGFSHRACHWYSASDPRAAASGMALVISAADPEFELPCLSDPSSAFTAPSLRLRLAIIAAQALRCPRGEQLVTSRARLRLLRELFDRQAEAFRPSFRREVVGCWGMANKRLGGTFQVEAVAVKEAREGHMNFDDSMFEVAEAKAGMREALENSSVPRPLRDGSDPLDMLQNRSGARESAKFWLSICPWLHCGDVKMEKAARTQAFKYAEDDRLAGEGSAMKESLIRDGFISIEGGWLPWAVDLAGVARGIMTLVDRGLPPILIMAYDEPWVMSAQMEQLSWVITGGNTVAFDWSAFCVRAAASAGGDEAQGTSVVTPTGWPPHRDRGSNKSAINGFREDGSPRYITLWVPMTDATPQTSCLMIVPRRRDPGYRWGDRGGSEISYIFRRPEDLQYIRSLPLATGGILAFNHRLFHWGSAADPRATTPRVSIAFTATDPGFEAPCFADPRAVLPLPALGVRLALAGAQALRYYGNDQIVTTLNRLRLFWSMFESQAGTFTAGFCAEVEHYNQMKFHMLEGCDVESF